MTPHSPTPEPLTQPKGIDPNWRQKIELAKQVRVAAKDQRAGKSPIFPMNWSLQPAQQ